MNRVKWTYKAQLDYISKRASGEWVIGFLDEEGNPSECPTTNDENLINKLKKLEFKKLKVTMHVCIISSSARACLAISNDRF